MLMPCDPGRTGARRVLLALAGLCVILAARQCAAQPFSALPVFANGAAGYRCYRIPAIVETPDGTLLAFAEARRNSCADFGDVRIVLRRSRDGGKSWSNLEDVASNGDPQTDNPVPVVDTMDPRYPQGRVFLIYDTGDAPESAVREGHGTRHVWYRTSVDDGVTWSAPAEITASVKQPGWRSYGVGPGHGLQLSRGPHRGRIFVAAYHSEGAPQPGYRDSQAHAFFSDDHGRTWSLSATVTWPGGNESTAAETGDDGVAMNSRDQSGDSQARLLSISRDGGRRWQKTMVAHDLPDPVCEGSMVSYVQRDGRRVLLFSNLLHSGSVRQGLTLSESRDGGLRWPRHAVLDPGASAYSDMVVMRGGELGVLWERGEEGIVFGSRPIARLF